MEMEKEQKKLLLVAVSVGVFLLVTITVAIMILTSKVQTHDSVFSASNLIQAGRIQPAENNTLQIVNNQETNNIDSISDIAIVSDRNDGDNLTIQIPRPTAAAVPDSPEVIASTPVRTQAVPATEKPVAVTQPAATQKPAATTQPAAQPRSTTASRPAASPARIITDYWVQAGAFAAIVRAEDARDHLASKGLTSIIENREIEGRTWYRVRMGPYTSENEANYWLALVKEIDGFDNSQVRQTTRQQ